MDAQTKGNAHKMVNNAPAADTLIDRANASNTDTSSNVPDEPTIIQRIRMPNGMTILKTSSELINNITAICAGSLSGLTG